VKETMTAASLHRRLELEGFRVSRNTVALPVPQTDAATLRRWALSLGAVLLEWADEVANAADSNVSATSSSSSTTASSATPSSPSSLAKVLKRVKSVSPSTHKLSSSADRLDSIAAPLGHVATVGGGGGGGGVERPSRPNGPPPAPRASRTIASPAVSGSQTVDVSKILSRNKSLPAVRPKPLPTVPLPSAAVGKTLPLPQKQAAEKDQQYSSVPLELAFGETYVDKDKLAASSSSAHTTPWTPPKKPLMYESLPQERRAASADGGNKTLLYDSLPQEEEGASSSKVFDELPNLPEDDMSICGFSEAWERVVDIDDDEL
jgi:hypothetical protein